MVEQAVKERKTDIESCFRAGMYGNAIILTFFLGLCFSQAGTCPVRSINQNAI